MLFSSLLAPIKACLLINFHFYFLPARLLHPARKVLLFPACLQFVITYIFLSLVRRIYMKFKPFFHTDLKQVLIRGNQKVLFLQQLLRMHIL